MSSVALKQHQFERTSIGSATSAFVSSCHLWVSALSSLPFLESVSVRSPVCGFSKTVSSRVSVGAFPSLSSVAASSEVVSFREILILLFTEVVPSGA